LVSFSLSLSFLPPPLLSIPTPLLDHHLILFLTFIYPYPEHHLKKISSAASAHAVGSGMSALDLILRLVKPGDTVLAGDDLYGGTNRLLGWLGTDGGVVS